MKFCISRVIKIRLKHGRNLTTIVIQNKRKSKAMATYYAILGVDHNSSTEDIKKKYQELALLYHPDKSSGNAEVDREKFQQITEAYKVLRDSDSRRKYNAELMHLQTINRPLIYATLDIKDLEFEEDTYYYSCRCGGLYTIPKDELLSPESLVACDECSLNILIIIDSQPT